MDGARQPVLGAGGNVWDEVQDVEFGCALGFGSSDTDETFRVNVPGGRTIWTSAKEPNATRWCVIERSTLR